MTMPYWNAPLHILMEAVVLIPWNLLLTVLDLSSGVILLRPIWIGFFRSWGLPPRLLACRLTMMVDVQIIGGKTRAV